MKLTILLILGLFVVYGLSVLFAIGWMKVRQWWRMRKEFCVYIEKHEYGDTWYHSECGLAFLYIRNKCPNCKRKIIVKGEE